MKDNKFVISCPTCGKTNKVIKKCFGCNRFVCSECSVRGRCHDCYLREFEGYEVDVYFEDKYAVRSLSEDELVSFLCCKKLDL